MGWKLAIVFALLVGSVGLIRSFVVQERVEALAKQRDRDRIESQDELKTLEDEVLTFDAKLRRLTP
jgi:hypothetical protein